MKILLLNEGYSDNLGDQAIKDSLLHLLKHDSSNIVNFHDFTRNVHKIVDITIDKKTDKTQQLSLKQKFKNLLSPKIRWILKHIFRVLKVSKKNYDLVVIGGGQLILSNATFAIAMFMWVFFLRLFGNKNIALFAVGSGTKFSLVDRWLFSYVFKRVSKIYVRDYKSQEVLKNIFNTETDFVYDVAFVHNRLQTTHITNKSTILLGIISFDVYSRYNKIKITKQEFFESWIKLLNDNNMELKNVKLFYTTQDDRLVSIEFQNYVAKKYKLKLELIETNTKDILVNELTKAKVVISARMHALILGLTYGCEIVTYPISDKLKEFDEMFGHDFDIENIQTNIELKIKEVINE